MKVVNVPVADCKPFVDGDHRNYRGHPEPQVAELAASLEAFGQYKNIVLSSDGFILAGEGVWRGAQARGLKDIAVVRMDFPASDPRAKKLLVADNELSRMAQDDDTALAALLADVQRTEGLQGTGWDDGALDALIGEVAAEGDGGKRGAGDVPFTEQLLFESNYVVFVFDNVLDFQVASEALGLEQKRAYSTLGQVGIERVVKGTRLLEMLQ